MVCACIGPMVTWNVPVGSGFLVLVARVYDWVVGLLGDEISVTVGVLLVIAALMLYSVAIASAGVLVKRLADDDQSA